MKIKVKANGHGPVCREDNSHRYIGDEPLEVEDSSYYQRRIMAGELVEVSAPVSSKKKEKE